MFSIAARGAPDYDRVAAGRSTNSGSTPTSKRGQGSGSTALWTDSRCERGPPRQAAAPRNGGRGVQIWCEGVSRQGKQGQEKTTEGAARESHSRGRLGFPHGKARTMRRWRHRWRQSGREEMRGAEPATSLPPYYVGYSTCIASTLSNLSPKGEKKNQKELQGNPEKFRVHAEFFAIWL